MKERKDNLKQIDNLTKQVVTQTKKVKELTDEISNWTEHAETLTSRIKELEEEAVGLKKKEEMDNASLKKEMLTESKTQKKYERLFTIVNDLFPAAILGVTSKSGCKKVVGTTSPRYIS